MKTKKLITLSLLVALSVVGGAIKINGSIALDSAAAFFGAILFGGTLGGCIGAIGHFISALMAGFPLSLPMHIFIMAEMFIVVYLFEKIYSKSKTFAFIVAVVLNGPIGTMCVAVLASLLKMPFAGKIMFITLTLPISIAAAINVLIAMMIYESINRMEVIRDWKQ